MAQDFIDNRQIRIFISSTFRDMQAERDYLVTKVFPELKKYCEKRDVSLFELDLRWGISEEEAKQGKVFEICLKEVIKTKPFFIGLLGERYGWIPVEDERKAMAENTSVFEDFPWVPEKLIEGTSITEIEMQEGVLRSKEKMNAYFYFRSQRIETPEEFRERNGSHEERKLSRLKKTLYEQKVYPIKEYDSIENLGTFVEKDFKALVDELFPQGSLSPLEKERLQQRSFFRGKIGVYVPNPELNTRLDGFIESGRSAIVITGKSGMGKSAFLANWIARRQEKNSEKILYHFIGASQSEGDYRKILTRLTNEVRDLYGIATKEEGVLAADSNTKSETGKQTEEFQNLLFSFESTEKLIIALDGVDRLVDTDNAKLMNWFPPFPENVKVIFCTSPDDKSMEVFNRRGYEQIIINAPPKENRKQIITDYLKSFSKALAATQVERIASDVKTENPLVLRTILDELRVFGVHEQLDQRIAYYLGAPDNEGLFAQVLRRIEEVFGETSAQDNLVKDILSLITVSRQGLSETEILELSGAAPLYWSQLSNGMAGHLSTMNGLVSFSNRMIQNAAKKRYVPDSETEKHYRGRIAGYMESNPQVSFSRKCDELPFQLFKVENWGKLHNFLLDHNVFEYIYKKDHHEIVNYWRCLREKDADNFSPEKYLELENVIKDKEILLILFFRINRLLVVLLGDYSLSLKFAEKAKNLCEELYGVDREITALYYNELATTYRSLCDYKKAGELYIQALKIRKTINKADNLSIAESYDNIGSCCKDLGEAKKSLEYKMKALEIRHEILGEKNMDTALSYNNVGTCYHDLSDFNSAFEYFNKSRQIREELRGRNSIQAAASYNNLGIYFSDLGDYENALKYHTESLKIRENLLGRDNPDTATSYDNIGVYYCKLGDYKNALEYHKRALEIREKLFDKKHLDIALSYSNMGACYNEMKNYQTAIEYLEKSKIIRDEILRKNHPDIANLFNSLGACHMELGDNDKAMGYYNAALEIYEDIFGKNNRDTARVYGNIGSLYITLGDYKKALEFFTQMLPGLENIFGSEHPETAWPFFYKGLCYSRLNDISNSLENYQKALKIREKTFGKEHSDTVITINNLGSVYYKAGNYQKALEYHLEALEIRKKLNAGQNDKIAFASNKVAMDYEALGKKEKALYYYNQTLSIYSSIKGQEAEVENVKQAVKRLT